MHQAYLHCSASRRAGLVKCGVMDGYPTADCYPDRFVSGHHVYGPYMDSASQKDSLSQYQFEHVSLQSLLMRSGHLMMRSLMKTMHPLLCSLASVLPRCQRSTFHPTAPTFRVTHHSTSLRIRPLCCPRSNNNTPLFSTTTTRSPPLPPLQPPPSNSTASTRRRCLAPVRPCTVPAHTESSLQPLPPPSTTTIPSISDTQVSPPGPVVPHTSPSTSPSTSWRRRTRTASWRTTRWVIPRPPLLSISTTALLECPERYLRTR